MRIYGAERCWVYALLWEELQTRLLIGLNQIISERALQEVDLAPFRAAVKIAHVAGIMCAYGEINGQPDCQDQVLFNDLKKEDGFRGFVRSDNGAVSDPVAAFNAGLDVIKPIANTSLLQAVATGELLGNHWTAVSGSYHLFVGQSSNSLSLAGRTELVVAPPPAIGARGALLTEAEDWRYFAGATNDRTISGR